MSARQAGLPTRNLPKLFPSPGARTSGSPKRLINRRHSQEHPPPLRPHLASPKPVSSGAPAPGAKARAAPTRAAAGPQGRRPHPPAGGIVYQPLQKRPKRLGVGWMGAPWSTDPSLPPRRTPRTPNPGPLPAPAKHCPEHPLPISVCGSRSP